MNYTKGEWRKSKQGWLIRTGEERICRVNHTLTDNGKDEVALANAHLIAAAPDMYEALKVALWHEEHGEYESQKHGKPRYCDVLATLRKALAKAEGDTK